MVKKWASAMVICVLVVGFAGGMVLAQDALVVTGLLDEDLVVTVEDLRQLPFVSEDVVAVNASGQENHFTMGGARFGDLLAAHGKDQANILGMRLVAGDGYAIDVLADILREREIILAYEVDGEPLDERTKPVRAIIPEERAMYWVRNLVKMEVLEQIEQVDVTTVRFLESLVTMEPLEDYTYYADVDQALNLAVTMDNLGLQPPDRVRFQASDGMSKQEAIDAFLTGYLKVSGVNAPLFLSPDLPKGMHVKDIAYFVYGDNGFVSLEQAKAFYGERTVEGTAGVSLGALADGLGLAPSPMYRLTAVDGYAVDVAAADLDEGVVFFDDNGRVRSFFPGLPRNTAVRGLYTIEAVLD